MDIDEIWRQWTYHGWVYPAARTMAMAFAKHYHAEMLRHYNAEMLKQLSEIKVANEVRAGHSAECDVFVRAPDFGPSQKPCNCRTGRSGK